MDSWLTLLPSCLSILLAVLTRQVYVAIFAGIMAGSVLLSENTFAGVTESFNLIAETFQSPGSVKSLIFILLIGAIINVMKQSGGIEALIYKLTHQRNIVASKTSAQLVTFGVGFLMCLEGIGSMMLVGVVGRPLFHRFELSTEKLAFVANCTGSPLAWLMPFSGAGVFLSGLLASEVEHGTLSGQPMGYVLSALPYQFYTLAILALVPLSALFHLATIQPHRKRAQNQTLNHHPNLACEQHTTRQPISSDKTQASAAAVLVPVGLLLSFLCIMTYITGEGDLLAGDISSAIYFSGFISLLGSGSYFLTRRVPIGQYVEWCIQGMQNMLPAAIILTLAFSLSRVTGELGTGKYLASYFSGELPVWLVPAAVFVACILISFSTGSSGATVSIMTPIVVSLAVSTGTNVPLIIAAMISGAVFGDQSSPISDSVIVAASAAGCTPENHFSTQLPYTVAVALLSLICYLIAGWWA
ncbi:Na+/H+ antiporter NhaC family protein [Photobacterium atrarenae]|uniref:Sodium:proton antiporter n=1 Tax=Photobacterium atrarenae TaxID=865757 RepID=A0ABY5GI49_9GAMM|nr:Na+/H+ antiporter NhaC family protein [Photobacterium atrarenae]UTV28831.1 sodium:proton antiporter [Photobacterium atrarenae]